MNENMEIHNLSLKTPFNMIISGCSGSGKTTKLSKLLQYRDILFNNVTENVIFFYNEWQVAYDSLKSMKLVNKFVKGIPPQDKMLDMLSNNIFDGYSSQGHQLLIFDDLVSEIQDDLMSKLFTVYGHHRNVSIILVSQALFNPSVNKFNLLQQNTHYLMFVKNPRDNSKVIYLAKQFSPYNINWVVQAFQDATNLAYGYIFFDFVQSTPEKLRLRTNIFPDELPMKVYVPP